MPTRGKIRNLNRVLAAMHEAGHAVGCLALHRRLRLVHSNSSRRLALCYAVGEFDKGRDRPGDPAPCSNTVRNMLTLQQHNVNTILMALSRRICSTLGHE